MAFSGNQNLVGAVYMLFSAFFLALIGVFLKVSTAITGLWQVSFYRALVGITLMLAMAGLFKVKLLGPNLKLLIIRGVFGATGFVFLTIAMRGIPLAEVLVLFYLFPAMAAVFSRFISNERLSKAGWAFIGLAFVGAIIILGPGGQVHPGLGHACALVTALLAGINTALVRKLSAEHSPYCIFFFFCLAAAILSVFPLAGGVEPMLPTWEGLWYLLAIGVVATVAQICMNLGFYHMPAAQGGVVMMSQVVMGALWGVLFFGEPLTMGLMLGGALIMAGGIGINLWGKPRPASPAPAPAANPQAAAPPSSERSAS